MPQTSRDQPTADALPMSSRRLDLSDDQDLTASDSDDDVPPPAYGEIHDHNVDEKGVSGTRAEVTSDGRVDIRINHLGRRLSRIFTPSWTREVQDREHHTEPLLTSSGIGQGAPAPPRSNIVIQVVGSRGDVQPFISLGKLLKHTYGHRVRLASHPIFRKSVLESGLEFFSIGGDPSWHGAFKVRNPGLMPGFRSVISGDASQRRRDVAEYIQGCWRSCYQPTDGYIADELYDLPSSDSRKPDSDARPFVADCIIANPASFAHIHCAEKLGVPLHIMSTMPSTPTQAFPHPLANIQASDTDPRLTNFLSYAMIEVLSWRGLGDILNRFRVKCLGLDPVSLFWGPGMLHRLKIPHTYCWPAALLAPPSDWQSHITISGRFLLDTTSDYRPSEALQTFLDSGSPPIYVGFGSVMLEDRIGMTELILEAVQKTGHRLILSRGWGGLGTVDFELPEGVFVLDKAPHDWLFQHVSCVVHHGGTGTTAAGITAGRPTVVIPFFGDQPFWGAIIAKAGIGPDPIPHKQITVDSIASAIKFCLRPGTLQAAKKLAEAVAQDRTDDSMVASIQRQLRIDRIRCALAPSRTAVWRIKRTQIRLSAFAACVLINANLLSLQDLKLYRAQEYHVDEGPTDPLSGAAVSCCSAFATMALGLADLPTEIFKALQLPFEKKRTQSIPSTSKFAGRFEDSYDESHLKRSSTLPIDQADMDGANGVQSRPDPSRRFSLASNTGASMRSKDSVGSKKGPGKNVRLLNRDGVNIAKGVGRFTKALVQAPMEVSLSVSKGLTNLPRAWGDDTVRPHSQAQVTGVASGAKVAGKEFALGVYDSITGLVTQPYQGAKKDGASGFIKGVGKGVIGFVTKSGAGVTGIPGYVMKGFHKEVQNMFSSNIQEYIVASRISQGHQEWLESSERDKQDVIDRWKLAQEFRKGKQHPDEMLQEIFGAQHGVRSGQTTQQEADSTDSLLLTDSNETTTHNDRYVDPGVTGPPSREVDSTLSISNQSEDRGVARQMTTADLPDSVVPLNGDIERKIQELMSLIRNQRQRDGDALALGAEPSGPVPSSSKAVVQNPVEDQSDGEATVERSFTRRPQRIEGTNGDDDDDDDGSDVVLDQRDTARARDVEAGKGPIDSGHIAGTRQHEYTMKQQSRSNEQKTQYEITEEQVVMEYIKKQSLLESQRRRMRKDSSRDNSITGTGSSIAGYQDEDEDEDEANLRRALKLSRQEPSSHPANRRGGA